MRDEKLKRKTIRLIGRPDPYIGGRTVTETRLLAVEMRTEQIQGLKDIIYRTE